MLSGPRALELAPPKHSHAPSVWYKEKCNDKGEGWGLGGAGSYFLSPHCHFQRNTNQKTLSTTLHKISTDHQSFFDQANKNDIRSSVKYVTKLEFGHPNTNTHICFQSSLTGFPTDLYIQVSVLQTVAPCPDLKNNLLGICAPSDLDGVFFQASIFRIIA